jgi:Ca2+:H+ antiporter
LILRILFLFIPLTVLAAWLSPENSTLLFLLSAVAIVPASLYIESATDRIAEHVGPTVGGLLNATFGNLPELFIGVATLKLGMYSLLKSQVIGGIVVNILFVSGAAMLMGGLKYKTQTYNTVSALHRCCSLASVALLLPSVYMAAPAGQGNEGRSVELSLFISVALLVTYFLYLFFTLKTHKGLIETPVVDIESKETSHQPLPVVVGILLAASLTAVWLSGVLVDAIPRRRRRWG